MIKRSHAFFRGAGLLSVALIGLLLTVSLVAAAQTDSPAATTGALIGDSPASGLAQGAPVKPPPPGGRQSPLRVMVPTDETWRALQAAGLSDITQISPNLDPVASFSPGPRMELFPGRPAGAPGFEAAPANPFRTLAILVQFTDKPAQVGATFFDTLVFGGGATTVRGYYQEASYGLLDIVTLNLPSSMGWVTAPQTYAYYTNGQSCLGSYPQNCQRLAEDVVALVDPVVNFANYDNNGDGWVDTVFIIHSGTGAEANGGNPNTIWSHSWSTNYGGDAYRPRLDGVYVGSYTTEPEFWFTPGDMTHGVYVHELGHAFGLPDLYDIDYTSAGVGKWSLMSSGSWNGNLGSSPAHLDAWSRLYLEFNPVVNVTTYNGTISLPNVAQNRTGSIYRLSSGRAGEYWLLENRQRIGTDATLPGSGLLIWHVDDNLSGSNRYECRQVNNYLCAASNQHFRVALEQADGALDLEYNRNGGDTGDPFPGSTGNTAFNFTTNPNTTSYYSTTNWGLRLSSISPSGATMTAYVGNPDAQAPPLLVAPANGTPTNDNTPTFSWQVAAGATSYRIQVSKSATFASTVVSTTRSSTTYTPTTALLDGLYYWRVQARGADGIWGLWSAIWTVTIDTVKPVKPILLSPVKDDLVTTNLPVFDWSDVADAVRYDLQVDNSSTFSSPEVIAAPAGSAYTVTTPLADGRYYWRVRAVDAAGNVGAWTSAWTVWVDIDPAPAPTLVSPANGSPTNDNTPTFSWNAVTGATSYRIQVSKSATFASTVINSTRSSTTYTPTTALLDGLYYWRVRARGADGLWGLWSTIWTVTVDTVAPARPTLLSPETKSILSTNQPALDWSDVADAARYELQVDNSSTFGSPEVFTSVTASAYTVTPPLPNGKYYWRVRTYDLAGNRSAWTSARSFTLAYMPAPLEMTTPTPMPTVETPVSGPGLIEAESDWVARGGAWTAHETAAASGGSYLYSSGSSEDALTLTFQGAQVSVIYVKHPALGVIVVEIDGTPVQLLDSLAEESVFAVQATFALAEGQHTLRVYPMMGTIALDAFLVEAALTPTAEPILEPEGDETPEPTVEPTGDAPAEPITEPTATLPPLLTPTPTVTPDPLTTVIEAEGTSVLPGGLWTRVETPLASGGAYLVSSGQQSQEPDALTLLFSGERVELIYATGPGLGKFLVEVDGAPVQLVDAQADLPDPAARLALTVGAGQHTLRLVVSEGVVAVDAFIVPLEAPLPPTLPPTQTIAPTATPLPTEVPPTPEPPTATPLPPEPPTQTPLPSELPPPEPTEGASAPEMPS